MRSHPSEDLTVALSLILTMKKFFLPLALSVAAGAVAVAPAFAQSNLRTVQSIPVQSEAYQLVAQSGNREQMSAIAQDFIQMVAAGNFEGAAQFLNPNFRSSWTPAQMQENWNYLQAATGAYRQVVGTDASGGNVVLVKTEFENVTDDVVVIFDESGQTIVGVDFPQQFPRASR